MKKGRLGVAVSLSLMVSVAVASTADAFGGRGGRGAFGGRPSGFSQPHFGHGFKGGFPFHGRPFGFSGGFNRSFPGLGGPCPGPTGCLGFKGFNHGFKGGGGFGGFAPWGTTTVYYGPGYDWGSAANYPVTVYAPQYYAPTYPAPAVHAPPTGSGVSATPTPSVVAFPGGHYELRGDGVTAPYQWVWVPNPPSAPPAPPAAPPAAVPPAQPPSSDRPSTRSTQLYRWTDEHGIVHWTNREEAVPAKYRKDAKYPPPA